jgi:hypothetical protein
MTESGKFKELTFGKCETFELKGAKPTKPENIV